MTSNFWSNAIALLDLVRHDPDNEKIYLYAKDPYEPKYQLISKHKGAGLKRCNDSKAFIECSNDIGVIYENINEYNPTM